MARILHVGCGHEPLPEILQGHTETRLDVDPECKPDIVASMTDMGDIGPFDCVYSCHCLEHLYPQDVPRALSEMLRVLAPGGTAMIRVPDLEDVRPTDDVVYESPAGPIAGLDMYYGLRSQLADRPYMAHHTGFVQETLARALSKAGFATTKVTRDPVQFELLASGRKAA